MKKKLITLEILSLGFNKNDFNLKKINGYLSLVVNELSIESFKLISLANKHNIDFIKDGYIYGYQALYSELGLKCDITTLC